MSATAPNPVQNSFAPVASGLAPLVASPTVARSSEAFDGVEVIGNEQGFALICANGSATGNAVMLGLMDGFCRDAVFPKSKPYRGEKTADVLADLDKQFMEGNAKADWAGRAFERAMR